MLTKTKWVPVINSEAGLSLTSLNWQEAMVDTVVYYIDSLLLKPGLKLLKEISTFSEYIDVPQTIIINASRLKANKEGVITLVSPYDGSKVRITLKEVIALINHLKPHCAILPPNIVRDYPDLWLNWDRQIKPFLLFEDLENNQEQEQNIYFNLSQKIDIPHFDSYKNFEIYVQGDLSFEVIKNLQSEGVDYIESDLPAKDGLEGLVYNKDTVISIKEESYSLDFEPISQNCACPTCSAPLSRAYLHHLYLHTPLLCQRFLIQHNAWIVQNTV